MMSDLNGRTGNGVREYIAGGIVVLGKNKGTVVDFCTERGIYVGNA